MSHEISVLLAGYMAGVVFGSVMSIALYRILIETGKLKPFGADKTAASPNGGEVQ